MNTMEDILPLIEQPSRYLGNEANTVRKDPDKVGLRVALAFPDLYEIGTSHFGLQILYSVLNARKDIAAERVFAPGSDLETRLKSAGIPLSSLESGTPLDRFDIIGFSLLYELNFTNILSMLDLSGIPFYSGERDDSHPLVIAGGPCTCNPEPLADFFDAMVVGDGETVVLEIAETFMEWKKSAGDRDSLLKALAKTRGVYVPSFFDAEYREFGGNPGFQIVTPKLPGCPKVERTIIGDLDRAAFPDSPIVPFGKPVHDRLRLEIARGCTRGCRFCQAGMIYRPVRERSVETLLALSDESLASTGYGDISLLSLSTGDYGCIADLMEKLMIRCEPDRVGVSLPSFRAGTLTPGLMELIRKVRKTGFTIAPEAGSRRLRDIINKNVSREDIIHTVESAFALGWQVIKLYFMIGLPFETEDDLEESVSLVRELRKIKGPKGRKGKINVSVGTFIPKSHTPFQWVSQLSLEASAEKIEWLKRKLDMPGIQLKWQNPKMSLIEGLYARGDRRLSGLTVAAYKNGCRFDGWSDQFRYEVWEKSFDETQTDVDFYTVRERDAGEPLPWDHIDMKVDKAFLKAEWNKAAVGEPTSDCRDGDCNACGVCDFETVAPRVFKTETKPNGKVPGSGRTSRTTGYKTLRFCYSKQGLAKYFGHLEMVRIFIRAIKRAGIPVRFSEGFHPMPKIAFGDPLPIGMESLGEFFHITVPAHIRASESMRQLNEQLPDGLKILDCMIAPSKSPKPPAGATDYLIALKKDVFDEQAIRDFKDRGEFVLEKINRKGKLRKIDLKRAVLKIEPIPPGRLRLQLRSEPGNTVRPHDAIREIFGMPEESIKLASVIKTGMSDVIPE